MTNGGYNCILCDVGGIYPMRVLLCRPWISRHWYVLRHCKTVSETSPLHQLPPSGTTLPSPNVCYISRHWLHLLKHCGNPGPIFQFDFACRHGAVHPTRTQDEARSLALTIRKDIWDAFHQQYGGGPFVERLEICARCKVSAVFL